MYPYFLSLSELERAVCHPLPDQGDRRAQPGGGRDGRQVYILHTVKLQYYIYVPTYVNIVSVFCIKEMSGGFRSVFDNTF